MSLLGLGVLPNSFKDDPRLTFYLFSGLVKFASLLHLCEGKIFVLVRFRCIAIKFCHNDMQLLLFK